MRSYCSKLCNSPTSGTGSLISALGMESYPCVYSLFVYCIYLFCTLLGLAFGSEHGSNEDFISWMLSFPVFAGVTRSYRQLTTIVVKGHGCNGSSKGRQRCQFLLVESIPCDCREKKNISKQEELLVQDHSRSI